MDPEIFDRLAPTHAPQSWLGVIGSPGKEDYVICIATSEEELNIWELKKRWIRSIQRGDTIVTMEDSPLLGVKYRGGMYIDGNLNARPVLLSARKNWFLRYRSILEEHLANPLPAHVHFYESRKSVDLFCTMRSTESGPFQFIKGADWPSCGHCRERMAFIGVLDFREYHRIGKARVPKGSLVLHGCDQCSIPCSDDACCSLTWITPDQEIEMWAGEDGTEDAIEIGVPWETLEFPSPAFYPEDLSDDPEFKKEWGIYANFTCPLNKIGGQLQWIQGDYTPADRNGKEMQFIGQFLGTRDVELADSGIVYLFFSDDTQETTGVLQFY